MKYSKAGRALVALCLGAVLSTLPSSTALGTDHRIRFCGFGGGKNSCWA